MKHDIYFLISPNSELVSKLERINAPGMLDLGRPVMWSGVEYDKSNLSHDDLDRLTKILFLDVLCRERRSEPGFVDVFVKIEITETYFDAHWVLQRTPLDMSIDIAIEDSIASGTIDDVERAGGDRLVEFLASFRKR